MNKVIVGIACYIGIGILTAIAHLMYTILAERRIHGSQAKVGTMLKHSVALVFLWPAVYWLGPD